MGSIKTISIIVAANIKGLEAGMGKANKSLAKFASNAVRVGSMMSFGVTAPLVALGKSAFDTFSKFENGMMKVKTVTGASVGEFKMLTEEAKRLGATTQFTALQVADLQLVLGRKGFDPTAIKNMEQSILDLALATGEDLSMAAEVTAASINAFQLKSSDAASVTNTLASAAANSSIQLSTFSTAFGHAGASANAVGVELEELSAMMGVLMDNGIKASKAGTGLRKIFSKLHQEGRSFTEVLDLATQGELGLEKAMKIAGLTSGGQLLILAKNKDKVKELTNEYKTNTTRLDEMAEAMGNTAHAKVLKMESAITSMKMEMGALISDAILPIIKYVTELAQSFSHLDKSTQKMILNIAAIAAVIAPVLIIIGLLSSLAAILSGSVALAIAGIGAAIYLVINIIDRFVRLFSAVGQAIGDNIEVIAERMSNFASKVKNFFIKAFTEAVAFIDKYAQKVGIDWFKADGEPVFDEIIPDDQLKKFVTWSDSVKKSEKRIDDLTASMKEWIKTKLGMGGGSGVSAEEESMDAIINLANMDFSSLRDFEDSEDAEIIITPKMKFDSFMSDLDASLTSAANAVSKFADKWGDSINMGLDIINQGLDNQMVKLENNYARDSELVANSLMNEEDKADAQKAIDDKMAIDKAKILRKQAIMAKAAAIISATINGAEAITKVAGQVGIGAIAAAPMMAALVGAQIAMIASAPIPAFAQGGLVTGATMGLVGEGRGTTMSNPEVIAPLDKLKSMLGDSGGGGMVIPDVRITGDDLLIVFDRASRRKERR
tara:strand:+ start:6560 stop:8890 length:2331 start_codon:yes stop_codon:yes gene_type:complete